MLVIETLWERLGIGKALRILLGTGKYAVANDQALLAMTANRLCEPESKLGVLDRWLERVHLPKVPWSETAAGARGHGFSPQAS